MPSKTFLYELKGDDYTAHMNWISQNGELLAMYVIRLGICESIIGKGWKAEYERRARKAEWELLN